MYLDRIGEIDRIGSRCAPIWRSCISSDGGRFERRSADVAIAVTEIARLHADLSGPQVG